MGLQRKGVRQAFLDATDISDVETFIMILVG